MNIELPAYIGDTVFVYPYSTNDKPIECKITKITINRKGIHFKLWDEPLGEARTCDIEDFGDWVFTEKIKGDE